MIALRAFHGGLVGGLVCYASAGVERLHGLPAWGCMLIAAALVAALSLSAVVLTAESTREGRICQ